MRMTEIIRKKRMGEELSREEIHFWISGCVDETIPDYQSAALLMAICLQGMSDRETSDLTMEMLHSGDMIEPGSFHAFVVDKHSTGGVGDKTSLILAPIVAACGVHVAKMSGRGLGHTGGTLDKLESIKGVSTRMEIEQFGAIISKVGAAIAGQTATFVPADKKLYALRDVTETVESIPLIASSIMSKKLACGADAILLDVKYGSGAFMKTPEMAQKLAVKMVEIGKACDRKVGALITDMDTPLGNCIGNLLEVFEAMETLHLEGPMDLTYESRMLAANLLVLSGKGDLSACLAMVDEVLQNGKAFEVFLKMIAAQGGDVDWLLKEYGTRGQLVGTPVFAPVSGYVTHTDTEQIGLCSCELGAGREKLEDEIDSYAGIRILKKYGDHVETGECLGILYSGKSQEQIKQTMEHFVSAYSFGEAAPPVHPTIEKMIF